MENGSRPGAGGNLRERVRKLQPKFPPDIGKEPQRRGGAEVEAIRVATEGVGVKVEGIAPSMPRRRGQGVGWSFAFVG
jgi:hypothetical protein